MSLPAEILKKVRMLDLQTRKLVNSLFAGEYHSAFKGQGMTFAEFREYVPGDDVRNISWILTARTGKPFIKKFDEERELVLILAVDVSGSTDFGTYRYLKGEIMTHLSAILGFSASKNNDQVGLLLFSDQVEHFVPPKKGRGHVHRILRDLYYYKPTSQRTRISVALDYLQGILKKRSTIFLFSDFMDRDYYTSLRLVGRKHDVITVNVSDPAEYEMPKLGLVDFEDAETGDVITVDTSSKVFREAYRDAVVKSRELQLKELRRSQVDRIDVVAGEKFLDPLIAFFNRRKAK